MIVYFDCFSGASGDMILGALVDVGLDFEHLRAELRRLPIAEEFQIEAREVRKGALRATKVEVITDGHHHPHRHLSEISALIESSDLPAAVKAKSLAIFTRLVEAEAKVHGIGTGQVHLHEVGAVDAIVDVVGSVLGLEMLGIGKVHSSPLPVNTTGAVQCAHGLVPLPAPATAELLARGEVPTVARETGFELVTPTGAAILTTLAEFTHPDMRIQKIGYGAGTRDFPWPNVLRLWLGEPIRSGMGGGNGAGTTHPERSEPAIVSHHDAHPEGSGRHSHNGHDHGGHGHHEH